MTSNSAPWLTQKSPEQWLQEARAMTERGQELVREPENRSLLACLKRGVGYATDAVRIVRPAINWGTAPVQQLAALATDDEVPMEVRRAAKRLQNARPRQAGDPVQLGEASSQGLVRATETIVEYCEQQVRDHMNPN